MAQLLVALEDDAEPEISGHDNLKTMALVDACYLSAKEHRAVEIEGSDAEEVEWALPTCWTARIEWSAGSPP